MKILDCYTDGSYSAKWQISSWAYLIIQDNSILHSARGDLTGEPALTLHHILGEACAVVEALAWANKNNIKLNICHDLIHCERWCADILDSKVKPWQRNSIHTQDYREMVFYYKRHLNSFIKIKAHSGDRFNEEVDKLVKYIPPIDSAS